jgi:cell volume regulation protein A
LLLVAAAVAVKVIPDLHTPPQQTVERVVTIALLCILFDGGLHIGRRRFRSAARPIIVVGSLGTFLTAGATAIFVHYAIGVNWYPSVLLATAVAPTDPAVVFSVLGQREVSGTSGTILEGESGANDPVGIALLVSLISAGGLSGRAFGHVVGEFALQMAVGTAIGVVGAMALLWFIRTIRLPSAALYPLRTLAGAFALYGVATLAHGSGFLAVFVAGIVLGDEPVPHRREIRGFHAALASLGEIVAFIVLGLTVDLAELRHVDVWVPGLIVGAVLAFVIRPILVAGCLSGAGLVGNEKLFVLFAGLKGAVPILLGTFLLTAGLADAKRLYGIVVVVVVFSVVVQGSLIPTVARLLGVPMRAGAPEDDTDPSQR